MNAHTARTKIWLAFAAMLLALTGGVACSDGKAGPKTADVKPGAMPSGAEWTGVYYDILFGNLHLVEEGSSVKGRWQRPRKGQWGQLEGTNDGNLLKFSWEEYIDGLAGPGSKKKGRGYFVYSRPEGENVDDVIEGEIGKGESEVGTDWRAIKQRNTPVDIESIGGSGAANVGGGDWDTDNKEKGEPEKPKEPDVDAPDL